MMSKSPLEVFELIQNMMSKTLLWNSLLFVDWSSDKELTTAKEFVANCLDFISEKSTNFVDNVLFDDSDITVLTEKYDKISSVVSSYYASMDRDDLMKSNRPTLAVALLLGSLPVQKEKEIDGCPF